ncbi:MAG: hypothetical protein MI723_02105 [Caulobacterales bacterium]|nr:hypothetical protein [Caulobacterales bacterium]
MTDDPADGPPFELFPPPEGERERVWVRPHWRVKKGKQVKVDGHWRKAKP